MKLLFRQACKCALTQAELPKPSFHITTAPDMEDSIPESHITIDLLCKSCGKPWESFAGLAYLPKKPKSRIVGVE